MSKEFYYKYFEENILPLILPYEAERKRIVRKVVFTSTIFFSTGLIFALLFVYNIQTQIVNPLLLPVMLFCMYFFILKSIITSIIAGKEFNKKFIEEIFPLFFPPVANFRKWEFHDLDSIIESKLFPNFDTLEDYQGIFGCYKNTNIILSNLRLTLPVRNVVKPDLFKGQIIQLELPESINNHIILISQNERKYNQYKSLNINLQDLNRVIYAFAKNSNGLGFLSEEFLEIIKKLLSYYDAKSVLFSYKDNTILLAIRQKKYPQYSFLFKSLLKPKHYDKLIERFIIVFDLIDFLNN